MMFYCDSVFVTGSHCTLEWCCVTFHLKPWYGITAPVTDELLLNEVGWLPWAMKIHMLPICIV